MRTTKAKHTAEPWRVAPTAPDTILADVKVGGCYSGHPEDFANAARIISCVNACAGMEDPVALFTDMRSRLNKLASSLLFHNLTELSAEADSLRHALGG